MSTTTVHKNIMVIGGGISGLSVLHFLKRKYSGRPEISIQLFEKGSSPGGTVKTIRHPHAMFECGPNGFLDSREATLRLVKDIGLESQLITANPSSKARFLFIKGKLHPLPLSFLSFLRFKPLSLWDKLRVPFELFVGPSQGPDESVYEFGARRLGENFSKVFLDPMVSGIFAGDAKKLHLKSVFPRMHDLEQKHGSLLKAAFKLQFSREKIARGDNLVDFPSLRKLYNFLKGKKSSESEHPVKSSSPFRPAGLMSLQNGMASLPERLMELYKDNISMDHDVQVIAPQGDRFIVHSNQHAYDADEIFLCTPADQSAQIIKPVSESLSIQLSKIYYAPVAVVGLVFEKSQLPKIPSGFGYLIPTWEGRSVLGVVFDSQLYSNRSNPDMELFRVMIGGACFPEVVRKTEEDLISLARQELHASLGIKQSKVPVQSFVCVWPKGIAQYTLDHIRTRETISLEISRIRNLRIVSNFIGGVSLNDCIANAETAVSQSKF